ncbi:MULTISPECIES: hypothetical protein [unclassified Bradyrhizobium]|uniref:hypothetical protein n=1 Tax=unclassified Bradyrhizobium TaxID=2631580 RepID=UPI001FFBF8EE|nr:MULTISPECIES: hypothetical protein [unclassified Bradyrhizobium]MCK1269188.1 hypothetical protein [Bradyrhizobium sp. 84]MCK1374806.1 hypothetical protein [Bradyrhizobium sp. 49]MCK1486701.1 hypothetical protein [Bradyrhizobium sp. 193]MCK1496922.1 hypothetical protein [Bradyrhizobium sp. 188]
MKTPKPKQWAQRELQQLFSGAGRSWCIEDCRRTGPPRRISEANGANDGDIVEEVAAAPRWRRISSKDQKARDATHLAFGQREAFATSRIRNLTAIVHPPSLASTSD